MFKKFLLLTLSLITFQNYCSHPNEQKALKEEIYKALDMPNELKNIIYEYARPHITFYILEYAAPVSLALYSCLYEEDYPPNEIQNDYNQIKEKHHTFPRRGHILLESLQKIFQKLNITGIDNTFLVVQDDKTFASEQKILSELREFYDCKNINLENKYASNVDFHPDTNLIYWGDLLMDNDSNKELLYKMSKLNDGLILIALRKLDDHAKKIGFKEIANIEVETFWDKKAQAYIYKLEKKSPIYFGFNF